MLPCPYMTPSTCIFIFCNIPDCFPIYLAGNDFVAARHMSLIPQNELCRDEASGVSFSSSSFFLPGAYQRRQHLPLSLSSSLIVLSFPHWPLYCCLCLSVHFLPTQPQLPQILTMLFHSLTDLVPFPSILARVHPSRHASAPVFSNE